MDTSTLVVSLTGTLVGGVVAVLVARYQSRRASRDEIAAVVDERIKHHADAAKALDKRIAELEATEPTAIAEARDAVDALAKDVATLRAALVEHTGAEEKRRGAARDMAVKRELETTRQLGELTGAVQRLQERMHDLLDAAGGFRGIARSRHDG